MRIDKSKFTAEEREQYEALIAKAKVEPEPDQEDVEKKEPPVQENPVEKAEKAEVEEMEETQKSASPEVPDFVKDAITKSEEFMARIEKQEMAAVAKKYAILGENPEELGEKLYNLKKSDPEMYESCISMLDNQGSMIEKSGLFTELGKSTSDPSGGVEAKAAAKAAELMKADPHMDYTTAIAKAWEDPALMAEYDAAYRG